MLEHFLKVGLHYGRHDADPLYSGAAVKDVVEMTRNPLLEWKVNKRARGRDLGGRGVAELVMWESDS